jgi:hypothetical protein
MKSEFTNCVETETHDPGGLEHSAVLALATNAPLKLPLGFQFDMELKLSVKFEVPGNKSVTPKVETVSAGAAIVVLKFTDGLRVPAVQSVDSCWTQDC